jgi:hypothetical protein
MGFSIFPLLFRFLAVMSRNLRQGGNRIMLTTCVRNFIVCVVLCAVSFDGSVILCDVLFVCCVLLYYHCHRVKTLLQLK